jgi:hypothetical protein
LDDKDGTRRLTDIDTYLKDQNIYRKEISVAIDDDDDDHAGHV